MLEIGRNHAVEAKVEREVVDEHEAERAAAQSVDAVDARRVAMRLRRGARGPLCGQGTALVDACGSSQRHAPVDAPAVAVRRYRWRRAPLELRLVGARAASAVAPVQDRPSRSSSIRREAQDCRPRWRAARTSRRRCLHRRPYFAQIQRTHVTNADDTGAAPYKARFAPVRSRRKLEVVGDGA